MAPRRICVTWLLASTMVSLIHGLSISSHEVPTSAHEGPILSYKGPTPSQEGPISSTSRTDQREQRHKVSTTTSQLPSTSTLLPGDNDDVNDAEADAKLAADVLHKFGYFRKGKPLHLQLESPEASGHSRTERDAQNEAIRMFQSFFGLEQTGVLDKATITLMKKDRCGVADIPEEKVEQTHHLTRDIQSPSDYSLLGTKWDRTALTWRLEVASNQLHPNQQRHTMEDAFATWGQVAPLKFVEKKNRGKVDIKIKFGRRHHGDEYPFDGKGKILAHAFGPGETEVAGDMHLDNDEKWSVTQDHGSSDLFLVATHELGHSLGLSHSRDPSALMFPYYGLTDTLGQDDIKAIQSLYGIRIGPPEVTPKPRRTTTTTTPKPVTRFPWAKSATYTDRKRPINKPRPRCGKFDAVIQDNPMNKDIYTGIRGDSVYRFNQKGVMAGYPIALDALYPGAPSKADAVFTIAEKSATYFIKDNKVWRYQGYRLDAAYPKTLNPSHFRETIHFVLPVVDTSGIQRIFVFGSTYWLEYNFDALPSYTPHSHVISQYWPGVGYDVIYAVTGYDGHIYFISPNSHVVLDSQFQRRAMYGGKQEGHPHWLQPACHMTGGSSGLSNRRSFRSTVVVTIFAILMCALRK